MNQVNSKHVSFGKLYALLSAQKESDELRQHLKSCAECEEVYEKLSLFLQSKSKPDLAEFARTLCQGKCPESEIELTKNADFFLAFLDKDQSEEQASHFLMHVNDCYRCLESFSINWNEYLTS